MEYKTERGKKFIRPTKNTKAGTKYKWVPLASKRGRVLNIGQHVGHLTAGDVKKLGFKLIKKDKKTFIRVGRRLKTLKEAREAIARRSVETGYIPFSIRRKFRAFGQRVKMKDGNLLIIGDAVDPYAAKGSVKWRTNKKDTRYSFTKDGQADRALLYMMLNDPAAVDEGRIPDGYKAFWRHIKIAPLSNKLLRHTQSPVPFVEVSANVWSGGDLAAELPTEPAPMRRQNPLPLAHIKTVQYDVIEDGLCVNSYFQQFGQKKFGKKRAAVILEKTKEPVNYKELAAILDDVQISLTVYRIDGGCIYENNNHKLKLDIIDHNAHMYPLSRKSDINPKPAIESVGPDKFEELLQTEEYEICTVSTGKCQIGDTLYKEGYSNKDSEINDITQFMGAYSPIVESFFDGCGIRARCFSTEEAEDATRYDIRGSHRRIMANGRNRFPVSNGLERLEAFSAPLVRHWFYLVDVPDYLYPFYGEGKKWMLGAEVMEYGLTPTRQFVVQDSVPGDKDVLKFDKGDICHYSGILATARATETTNYRCTDDHEIAYFMGKPGAYHTGLGVGINKESFKQRTGMLAYLAIISYQNLLLYKMWEELGKPPIVSIYSDCLGVLQAPRELPEFHWYKKEEVVNVFPTVTHGISPIDDGHCKTGSMFISGLAGLGKSYYVRNTLIPQWEKEGLKYVLSSSTKENAAEWGGLPIQTHLKKSLGWRAIVERFKEVDVLVIDECSQLGMVELNKLIRLKKEARLKMVFIGDENQCLSVDDIDYLGSPLFKKLSETRHTMEYHDKCRFTRAYYDFLKAYLDGDNTKKEALLASLKRGEPKDAPNICWTHATGKTLDEYATIHSTQGKTIEGVYNLYDLHRVKDWRVIYTALSRARDFKYVNVVDEAERVGIYR